MTTTAAWRPPTIRATKTAKRAWRALIDAGKAPDTDLETVVAALVPPPGTPREHVRVRALRGADTGLIDGDGWKATFEKKPGLDGRKYWSITHVRATGAASSGRTRARARAREVRA